MGSGKPKGIRAARKLKKDRRQQLWHDKHYWKSHSGRAYRWDPLGGSSMASGIWIGKVGI